MLRGVLVVLRDKRVRVGLQCHCEERRRACGALKHRSMNGALGMGMGGVGAESGTRRDAR